MLTTFVILTEKKAKELHTLLTGEFLFSSNLSFIFHLPFALLVLFFNCRQRRREEKIVFEIRLIRDFIIVHICLVIILFIRSFICFAIVYSLRCILDWFIDSLVIKLMS